MLLKKLNIFNFGNNICTRLFFFESDFNEISNIIINNILPNIFL